MKHYKKIEVMGYVILILLWFILSQLLVGNITYLIFGKTIEKAAYESFYNGHRYAISLNAQVLCLGVLLGIDYKNKQFEVQRLWVGVKETFAYMGIGVLLYCICIGINILLLPYFPGYSAISEMFNHNEPVLNFLVIVIMAPVLEEYVFRGKIQSLIRREFNPVIAIFAQALLFGSLHSLALQKIYASVMGIFLGIIKEKTNKLQSSIVVHMTVNLIGWLIGVFINV